MLKARQGAGTSHSAALARSAIVRARRARLAAIADAIAAEGERDGDARVAGTQVVPQNLAPNFVYVHFWVGLVIVSVLLGDVFRAFNPWRAAGRASNPSFNSSSGTTSL